jgi:hypothetical protein
MLVDLAELAALVEGERFVRRVQHGGIGAVVHPMPTMGTWFAPPVRHWICVGTVLSRAKYKSRHVQQKLAARRCWQGSGRA